MKDIDEKRQDAEDAMVWSFRKEFAGPVAEEMMKLYSYVDFLLHTYNIWGTDGTYTFPDGETFRKGGK